MITEKYLFDSPAIKIDSNSILFMLNLHWQPSVNYGICSLLTLTFRIDVWPYEDKRRILRTTERVPQGISIPTGMRAWLYGASTGEDTCTRERRASA